MRLTKIKYLNELVIIAWEVPVKGGRTIKNTIESPDDPTPELVEAVAALKPHLIEMCEVEKLPNNLIYTTGVSLSYKGDNDTMNAVLTGVKTHANSGGCLILNSPNKPSENTTGEDTASANLLSEPCVERIEQLIVHAKEYINGKRGQVDMGLD